MFTNCSCGVIRVSGESKTVSSLVIFSQNIHRSLRAGDAHTLHARDPLGTPVFMCFCSVCGCYEKGMESCLCKIAVHNKWKNIRGLCLHVCVTFVMLSCLTAPARRLLWTFWLKNRCAASSQHMDDTVMCFFYRFCYTGICGLRVCLLGTLSI